MGKLKKMIKDKKGMSYPLTVALVLALLIALCVLAEFFRLSIIAYGVRNALQESVISVATTNYNEVYDGLREGYSGGYFMTGLKCCLCRKNQNGKWNFSGTVFPVEKFQKLWSMLESRILSMMGNIRTAGIPMRG